MKYDSRYYMNAAEGARMDISQLHRIEYEASPDVVVNVPGVVRLLGEHTVDADGMYLGLPYDRSMSVAMSARRDSSLRFFAADLNERKRTNLGNLKYKREDRWANYIKGALSAYLDGRPGTKGLNVSISGDIPQGLGLGSANALLCASVKAAATLSGAPLEPAALEQTAAEVMKHYFERPARSAEYSASLRAEASSLLLVDAYDARCERLDAIFSKAIVLLCDSKVPRPPVDDELRSRIQNCAKALATLGGGARGLRSYTIEDLDEFMGRMPEYVRRHATFFIEELQRIKDARESIVRKDLPALSRILNKSQAGLRNHYELSCPEIDWLVKRAIEIDGVLASRMVGKGFGGCTLTILLEDALPEYRKRLEEYERIFGFRPVVWEIKPWHGADANAD
jgi:galactokinase